jgi:AcrR family transcriptional regulator
MAHSVPEVERAAGMAEALCSPHAGRCDPRVERTRQAALAAAATILEEHGWEAVTHVAVSERSGVGRSTLYRHWADATALLIEVIADQALSGQAAPTGDLRQDLLAELERFRQRLLDPACERGMVTVMERATVDPDFADMRAAITSDATKAVRASLEAAGARGELDISPGVDVLVAQLAGPLAFRRLFARQPVTRRFVAEVVDSFLVAHRPA